MNPIHNFLLLENEAIANTSDNIQPIESVMDQLEPIVVVIIFQLSKKDIESGEFKFDSHFIG